MKIQRSKNAIRSTYYGVINKFLTTLLPFIVRTVFIKKIGIEYLGLNSLFSSILSVLSLADLGLNTAIVFSMYKPIANDDNKLVNALLFFYKKIYFYIGLIVLIIGITIMPFLKYLIKGNYPRDINIYIVYFIFLFNSCISYWFFGYIQSLISALQRDDINYNITSIITIIYSLFQIAIIYTFRNYYYYLILIPIFTLVKNYLFYKIVTKKYSSYRAEGKLDKNSIIDISIRVKGLVIQKLCVISRNSFDSIFISMFLGLSLTAKYSNYYLIMSSITGLLLVFISSIESGIGNSIAIETETKNYNDLLKLDFLYMWFSGWCTTCLLSLYQPFMILWVGESNILPFKCVVSFSLYFYVLKMGDIRSCYTSANGLWWENRYRAIFEAIANICLNYILGKYFGIVGIITATIISLLVFSFLYGTCLTFKYYFIHQKRYKYFINHIFYLFTTVIVSSITLFITTKIMFSVMGFIFKIIITCIIPNILFLLIYSKFYLFNDAVKWAIERLPNRFKNVSYTILNNIIKR